MEHAALANKEKDYGRFMNNLSHYVLMNYVVEKLKLLRKENRKSLYVTVAIFVLLFIIYMLLFSE